MRREEKGLLNVASLVVITVIGLGSNYKVIQKLQLMKGGDVLYAHRKPVILA